MVLIQEVKAEKIKDSRKEETIKVTIKTNIGKFSSSAPNGKSKGKREAKPYKKTLEKDIEQLKELSSYFNSEILENFQDLKRIEEITQGLIGANTSFALESAILKAIAKEQKKEIWQIINPNAKRFPRLVGNCIGGGSHSKLTKNKKPDFQEFLLIPKERSPKISVKENINSQEEIKSLLKKKDSSFEEKKNDENAWQTSLNEKEILEILQTTNQDLGLDIAASSFYQRKKYKYENPMLKRTPEEQMFYISNLIKNYPLKYLEDPFEEEDFDSFKKLLEFTKSIGKKILIVGDDLTVTNLKRLKKAVDEKSINAVIIKPNQNGSLIEVEEIIQYCKKNKIKTIFSHRSGETEEPILADLAFGFQSDYIKTGISGEERLAKLKRLIEIEKNIK